MKKRKPTKRSKRKAVPSPPLHKRKRERDELEQKIKRLQQANERLQHELTEFRWAEKERKREQAANWAAYDRAVDDTTQAERELFAASPAYQKYQQWRRDGYHATESKRVDAIKYLHARGRLNTGDWMSP